MSKIAIAVKNVAGNIQEGVGKVLNNETMIEKGEQKQAEAQQQKVAADPKSYGNVHSAQGTIEQHLGEVINNSHPVAQGEAEHHHGNSQYNTGKPSDLTDRVGTGAGVTGTHYTGTSLADTHPLNSHATEVTNPTGPGYVGTDPYYNHAVNTDHHTAYQSTNPISAGVPSIGAGPIGVAPSHNAHHSMGGENPSTMSGKKDQAVGAMKQDVGDVFNHHSHQVQGANLRYDGQCQEHMVRHQPGTVTENSNAESGAIRENAGYATGNPYMELNGATQRTQGDTQYNVVQNHGVL